jgi:hypothetical protein
MLSLWQQGESLEAQIIQASGKRNEIKNKIKQLISN